MRIINVVPEMDQLQLGKQGENKSTKFLFDVSDWLEKYPGCTITLVNRRPNENSSYPCVLTTEEDGRRGWVINSADLANDGKGECELKCTLDDMIEKDKRTWKTKVKKSLSGDGDAPEPWESLMDDIEGLVGDAQDAAEDAEAAKEAAEEAASIAAHAPIIQDGYWYEWDATTEQYVNTEVKAQGEDGDPGQDGTDATPALITVDYSDLTFPVAAGTMCYHSGLLYKANQAIATSEEWTAAHWTQTTIEAEQSALKSEINSKTNELKSEVTYKADKVYGGATSNNPVALTPCKAWHATYGTMVNGSNRASGGPIKVTPDMKSISVASGYAMLLYGNNEGVGHALSTISSWATTAVNIVGNIAYKYIFPMICKYPTQSDFSPSDDLSGVVNITIYGTELNFALDDDLKKTDAKAENNKEDLFETEKTIGVIHLNPHKENIINNAVLSTNGKPTGTIDNTRACTNELLQILPNTPIYYTRPSTGYFNPIIYYFKNGIYQGYDSSFDSGDSYDADEARFLFFKNPNTANITPQEVEDNFVIWQETSNSYNNRIKALEGGNDYSLIAYGDSLTTGAGATDTNHTYWGVCATQLNMKNRIGFGYGGSKSRPIAFTAGALTGYVPPSASSFALKYADLTTDISIAANALNGKTVIIGNNEHIIGQTGATAFTLPNTYTPVGYWTPVTVKNSRYTADIYIIWVGTNDGGMQWDIVDAMIAKLPHKRYVLMGLTRLGTDTSVEDEQKGYEKYGSHYLNIRMQIINSAFALIGKTPTAEDTTAMNAGLMPPSLLSDELHFNDDGYEAIGKILAKHIQSLGYSFQTA